MNRSAPSEKTRERANAGQGMKRIDWARAHMPILRNLMPMFGDEKPFAGLTIGICLHVESKTGVWLEVLREGGAEIVITGSPGTTDDDVAVALASKYDIKVHTRKDESFEDHIAHCQTVLSAKPDLIADNGGDLHHLIYSDERFSSLVHSLIGATEETTTGATRLTEEIKCADFPTLIINHTLSKRIVENRYGVGSSVVDGMMRATNVMIHGKAIVVIGYGYCGSGVAQRFRGMGGRVTIVETDPLTRLEAHLEGFNTATLEQCLPNAELVITVTGYDNVLRGEHFELMLDNTIIANAGHFATEIDVEYLHDNSVNNREIRRGVREFTMKNGSRLFLLVDGNLVNLAAADGNPIEIMDLGLALQALSLRYLVQNSEKLSNLPQTVPIEVQRYVAEKAVEHWIEHRNKHA